MPNRPITAIRKSKPVSSSVKPKVSRSWPVMLVEADGGERKADHHRRHGLERRLLAHADEAAEGQEIDAELLRRPELQREGGDQRRHQRDHDDGEQRADEGGGEGGGQRLAGPALLRHRMAVEGGRHRPWLAGDVEQDRGDGAAEQRAPVDAGQHDDRRGRRHREGQRQQDRDAVGAAQAGQHADEDAEQDADDHHHDVERLEHDRKAVKQIGDFFHVPALALRDRSSSSPVSETETSPPSAPSAAAPGTISRKPERSPAARRARSRPRCPSVAAEPPHEHGDEQREDT